MADAKTSNLMSLTGLSAERAKHFLESAGDDVNLAATIYFSSLQDEEPPIPAVASVSSSIRHPPRQTADTSGPR